MNRVTLLIAALLLSSADFAMTSAATIDGERVTATIVDQLARTHAVGAAVAIVSHDSIVYERGFGVRDLRQRDPVDPRTHFEIGSDTKQFTAAAILQLAASGKLALTDQLDHFVPDFPHAHDLTLLELLQQTSGLPDYVATNHFVTQIAPTPGGFARIAQLAAGPLHFAPGSKWEYSNTNYIALGRVIEVATGNSYDAYIRAHLFAPLHMLHSTTIARETYVRNRALGYWRGMHGEDPLQRAPQMLESWTWSAGDIVSTVEDLSRWDIGLPRGIVISASDFRQMITPATLSDGSVDDYGFGWWIETFHGHRRVYHDGDTFGFSSSNNLFPDDDVAIVVLENEPNDAAGKLAIAIASTIFAAQ